jgi:hypothetical protein
VTGERRKEEELWVPSGFSARKLTLRVSSARARRASPKPRPVRGFRVYGSGNLEIAPPGPSNAGATRPTERDEDLAAPLFNRPVFAPETPEQTGSNRGEATKAH